VSGAWDAAVFGGITSRFMDDEYFPGAVLRVERQGQVLLETAWGHASAAGLERTAMTPSTIFDAASLTKLFTATAVLRLVSTGVLGLDTQVSEFLGLDPPLSSSMEGIDVTALLTHSSGIPWWFPFYTRRGEPFLDILADVIPARPPRGEVVYSDLNFMILGIMIERGMHAALPDAVEELVIRPLGLTHTSFARPRGRAAATEWGNRIERRMVAEMGLSFDGWRDESRPVIDEPNDGNCHYYFRGTAGHAGIFTDAPDLCRLGRLYLDGGRVDGEPWLAPGVAEDAMREHAAGRGLGFQLGEPYPRGACGHTGFTGTCLMLSPSNGVVAALLTNRLHTAEPRDIDPYRRQILQAIVSAGG
jgi:serine-type D-Ala-D-Ala carboxypeptidase